MWNSCLLAPPKQPHWNESFVRKCFCRVAWRCAESPPLCAAAPWQLWDQERLLERVQVEQQPACRDQGGSTPLQAAALNSQLGSGYNTLKTCFSVVFFIRILAHLECLAFWTFWPLCKIINYWFFWGFQCFLYISVNAFLDQFSHL